MRASKVFSFVFGILGTTVMLFALILCLTSLNGGVRMTEVPSAAQECTQRLMSALEEGDYLTAESLLYGQTKLGDPRESATEEGKLVWQAYLSNFSYGFSGDCYGTATGICRDVTITTLDIPSATAKLQERARAILDQKIADAKEVKNMSLVYDEDGATIREEVLSNVLQTAVTQALTEDIGTLTTTVTLELINENGNWQVVPSQELLKAVAGGL